MLKVTVDRDRWIRGEINSRLLREGDRKMCCLGFACIAAGVPEAQILGVLTPASVKLPQSLMGLKSGTGVLQNHTNSYECSSMMIWNDRVYKSAGTWQEDKLISLGRQVGIEFKFVGGGLEDNSGHPLPPPPVATSDELGL